MMHDSKFHTTLASNKYLIVESRCSFLFRIWCSKGFQIWIKLALFYFWRLGLCFPFFILTSKSLGKLGSRACWGQEKSQGLQSTDRSTYKFPPEMSSHRQRDSNQGPCGISAESLPTGSPMLVCFLFKFQLEFLLGIRIRITLSLLNWI